MKHYLYLLLMIIMCGCGNPYPNENELKKAYSDGVVQGMSMCIQSQQPHLTDTFSLTIDPVSKMVFNSDKKNTTETYLKHLASKIIVDSIEFKYDSIMVIHYNQSEVK